MRRLFVDLLGFAGVKITAASWASPMSRISRRIADDDLRASCEKRALKLARSLMVERASFSDIGSVKRRGAR